MTGGHHVEIFCSKERLLCYFMQAFIPYDFCYAKIGIVLQWVCLISAM